MFISLFSWSGRGAQDGNRWYKQQEASRESDMAPTLVLLTLSLILY